MSRLELVGWGVVAVVLVALGVPWFLWGSDVVLYGVPVWLWWHVGWMVLASLVFWVFADRAWGIGIEPESSGVEQGGASGDPAPGTTADSSSVQRGDRR